MNEKEEIIAQPFTNKHGGDNEDCPRVAEFFRNKTIAVTGGTGSLGQGVIEKLLRCCPQIKKIYIFIRKKKEVDPQERLANFNALPVFDLLREISPNFGKKLFCISCDLEKDGLGLSCEDKALLQKEVDVFIHSAASLRFNEHLRKSFATNVHCVRQLLQLCRGMTQLKSFVHISSAYSHCNRSKINEKFYPCDIDYTDLESTLKCLSDEDVEKITPDLLGRRPNTYTFTKALGEDVIARESENLPVCIARPSMIVPAWQEPLPGWCTNIYGPTAFFVAYGRGILRSAFADESIIADLIPIDLVVNGILAAAVKTACDFTNHPHSCSGEMEKRANISFTEEDFSDGAEPGATLVNIQRNIPIYHFTTGSLNPLYVYDYVKLGKQWFQDYPLDPHRLPRVSITCNRFLHRINTFLQQTIPAYMDDAVLSLTKQKRRMTSINEKLIAAMDDMEFFFTNEWMWENRNMITLQQALSPHDRLIFNFDPQSYSWKEYLKHYVIGTRKYIAKQDMNAYPEARRAIRRLKVQNVLLNSLGIAGLSCLIVASGAVGCAYQFISSFFNLADYFL